MKIRYVILLDGRFIDHPYLQSIFLAIMTYRILDLYGLGVLCSYLGKNRCRIVTKTTVIVFLGSCLTSNS